MKMIGVAAKRKTKMTNGAHLKQTRTTDLEEEDVEDEVVVSIIKIIIL
jgi:hypothetical protein